MTASMREILHELPIYHMKIMLQNFTAKLSCEYTFKWTTEKKNFIKFVSDNEDRVVNFAI